MNVLIGNEEWSNEPKRTQVFDATHKYDSTEAKWLRQSYMNRSFISFSFGGKWIEDFNLIATIENDRMQRTASAPHEDLVSNYEILDGQFYWGTRFQPNQLNLILATDAITENELDEFKHWFCGGATRELILAEHPNRAIMARVGQTSNISVLPFEEKTTVKIAGEEFKTSTTVYRGQIGMVLVMDEPFWYSKVNLFGKTKDGQWVDVWDNANGIETYYYDDVDALKIIKEDGLPVSSSLTGKTFLMGGNLTVDLDFSIVGETDGQQTRENPVTLDGIAVAGASANDATEDTAVGFIAGGRTIDLSKDGINMANNANRQVYYAGTAPIYPTLNFTFTPTLNSDGYIDSPRNIFVSEQPYDTITLESEEKHVLKFTLPGAYYGYNQAIQLFRTATSNAALQNESTDTIVDLTKLRELVRGTITHKAARAWAIAVVDNFNNSSYDADEACNLMKKFLLSTNDGSDTLLSSTVCFNGKNGICTGVIGYNLIGNQTFGSTISLNKNISEENVGDMIKSNHLILQERNYPDDEGFIRAWEEEHKTYSHKLYYQGKENAPALQHFNITYQYMYY